MNENSGPHDTPGVKRPPRAEPIQPDRPGRGDSVDKPSDTGGTSGSQDRSNDALDNVREGYD